MEINTSIFNPFSLKNVDLSNITMDKREKVSFLDANVVSGSSKDFLLLNPPVSETTYKRTEFVTDDSMAEGCAYCYSYMERTIKFADGGTFSIINDRNDGYWCINMDTSSRTFGSSGADMNDISHAVEETWERKELSFSESIFECCMSGAVIGDYQTAANTLGFSLQSTALKYSSASYTKGTVAYKNGNAEAYGAGAMSTREIYNKCAVFVANAFGEKTSDLILSGKDFNDLFGNLISDNKTPPKNDKAQSRLAKLREYMESRLSEVRRKKPGCSGLNAFADAYQKIEAYKYSDLTAFITKFFDV